MEIADRSTDEVTAPCSTIYKLRHERTTIVIAEFITDQPGTLVHGQQLKKEYAKFLIRSVFLRSAIKWSPYEPDIHIAGSYYIHIQWPKEYTAKKHVANRILNSGIARDSQELSPLPHPLTPGHDWESSSYNSDNVLSPKVQALELRDSVTEQLKQV